MASTPTYRRIADEIRDQITRGVLKPTDQLPTEDELMVRHQVARGTIRRALRELVNQGLLVRQRRLGTFVASQYQLLFHATVAEQADRPGTADGRDAFFAEVEGQGRKPAQDFSMRGEPAAPDVAARLGVDEDELVIVRACFRYVDGHAWSDQVSYYAMDVAEAAGLATAKDIAEGTVRRMAAAGYVEVGYRDEVGSRMPTPEEAQQLDIRAGVPVLLYYRTTYNEERPLRVTRTLFPADRNTIIYELGDLVAFYAGARITVEQDEVR